MLLELKFFWTCDKIHIQKPSSGEYIGITLSVHLTVNLSVQIHVRPIIFFLLWHWLTIFGICVYHLETMCGVHSWSDTTLTFDLKVNFIRFLTCLHVRLITFFCLDIALPYLANGCITMRGCVTIIGNPDTTVTCDFKVKFISFLTCFCDIGLPYMTKSKDNLAQTKIHGKNIKFVQRSRFI